ncbi:hypothetical protein K502DRAFT_353363 [Neoconidiobolus thromboides FSU 785]|nr:hypothetical protein K502DRAFT_353363 [Neoconidiobolus thromboides FSU 785]
MRHLSHFGPTNHDLKLDVKKSFLLIKNAKVFINDGKAGAIVHGRPFVVNSNLPGHFFNNQELPQIINNSSLYSYKGEDRSILDMAIFWFHYFFHLLSTV